MITNPEHPGPGETPRRAQPEQTGSDQLQAAFDAFSSLPGVSPNNEERREQFVDAWAGSWTDPVQLTRDLTGIASVEDAINNLSIDAPTTRFIHIDYQALDHLVAERWDIVHARGMFHAFEK